jgi:hypothetical protein
MQAIAIAAADPRTRALFFIASPNGLLRLQVVERLIREPMISIAREMKGRACPPTDKICTVPQRIPLRLALLDEPLGLAMANIAIAPPNFPPTSSDGPDGFVPSPSVHRPVNL